MAEHRLAADDENPGIHDGVEGVEAEGRQVLCVPTKGTNEVDEPCNLMKEKVVRRSDVFNTHITN